jgi:hypothetical protein
MKNRNLVRKSVAVLTIFIVLFGLMAVPAYAHNNHGDHGGHGGDSCVNHRKINNFNNRAQVEAQGFFFQMFNSGTYSFKHHVMSLDLGTTQTADYSASRISEIDTINLPPEQQTKCWQPTNSKDVVVKYTIRFDQAMTPGLTENAMLWNAGLATGAPLSAFGVTRSPAFGGAYLAIAVQDFDFVNGLLVFAPMPVDPTQWHTVRVTLSQTHAKIEVAQGGAYMTVMDQELLHAPNPTGFEFSVDNEAFPGYYVPVQVPDGMDISKYAADLTH